MDQSHQIDADYNQFINELVGIFHEKWLERCPGNMPLDSDLLLDIGEKIESIVNYADENATTQEEAKHSEASSAQYESMNKQLNEMAATVFNLQSENTGLKTALDASARLIEHNQEQDAKVKKIVEVLKSGQAWLVDPNTGLRLAEALDRVATPQAAEPVTCVNCESWKRLYKSLESQFSGQSLLRNDERKAHQEALDQKNKRINEHMQSITDLNNKLQLALNKIAMHEQAAMHEQTAMYGQANKTS